MSAPRIFTSEYYDRMRGLEAGSWWNAGMRDVAARLLRLAHLPPAGRGLDIGCGSGQTLAWLAQRLPGWQLHGFDVAPDAVRASREMGLDGLARASALALPYRRESVDLVVTLDVLQHLPLGGGDRLALAEMRRVLRPCGTLLLRTNAQAFPATPDDRTAMFHQYRPRELGERLRAAGFRIARLSRINAVLGLAEIPRELRARSQEGAAYHGMLGMPAPGPLDRVKRWWLGIEGMAVEGGLRLPLGRTIVALCRTT